MKKYLHVAVAFLFSLQQLSAQHVAFKKLYSTTGPSNQGSGIVQLANGDFIIAGIRSVPNGTQYIANIFLFRINEQGDTVWTKEIGTSTERELAYDLLRLPNGNLIISGSINIPPAGLSDALVICTDTAGKVLWQRQYGGTNSDFATGAKFDGQHIMICGITESYGAGDRDAWLLKLTTSGDTVWTRTFGGAELDDAWDIEMAYNEYYLTGGTYSFADGQYDDAWVVKVNASGDEIWHKTYGIKDKVDWAWSLTPVVNNGAITGFVFTGVKDTEETQPGNAYGNLHLVKIDTAGSVVWDKSFGGSGTNWRREGFGIRQLPGGGFVICGYKLEPTVVSQQLYVVQTDSNGTVVWETATGTRDSSYYANAITVTNDGGWAITGSVFTPMQQIRYIYVTRFKPYNVGVVDAAEQNNIVLFPNPTTDGVVYLKKENVVVSKVQVFSTDGKLVHEASPARQGDVMTINIPAKGLFLIKIHTDKGIVSRRLVH